MSESCKYLTEFGKENVRSIGEDRTEEGETPSKPRYYAAILLKLTGEVAAFVALLTLLVAPLLVGVAIINHGQIAFDGWRQATLQFAVLVFYGVGAQRAAKHLGYQDWWGLPL